jgi:hypothetical protein
VPRYSTAEAEAQIAALPAWRLTHDGTRIRRDVTLKNFREAVKLVNNIAALAERLVPASGRVLSVGAAAGVTTTSGRCRRRVAGGC